MTIGPADVPRLVADGRARIESVAHALSEDSPARRELLAESEKLAAFETAEPRAGSGLTEVATAYEALPGLEELTRLGPDDAARASELVQLAVVFRWILERTANAVPEDPLRRPALV
jgi:hypothetical protein